MDRVVLVVKPTRLEELVREHHTEGAARFALESRGQSIEEMRRESAAYAAALAEVRRQIPSDIPTTLVQRESLPHVLLREKDVIVAVGPDGLIANLAQYVKDQPIVGVNPDPRTVQGVLMSWSPSQVGAVCAALQKGTHKVEKLPLARALLDDGRVLWALNEIFIGRRDQAGARYEIEFKSVKERQLSSGLFVSTGVGTTAWLSSVVNMLSALMVEGSHALQNLPHRTTSELVFLVREPFKLPDTKVSLVTGRVVPSSTLVVRSEMPRGGCIFSDGILEKAIEFNAGTTVTVTVGERYVQRVVR